MLGAHVCVVTGASSGVGFGASIGLARSGFHVVMLCRDQARGEAAREAIGRAVPNASSELVLADLADFDAVRRAAETISRAHPRIRLLLNNAGVYLPMRRIGPSGVEMNFAVHVVGPHLLTERLLPCLRAAAPARIINLTGELHRRAELVVDDLQLEQGYSGMRASLQSQLVRILVTNEWARRLEGSGVTASSVHPGAVRSEFSRHMPWYARAAAKVVTRLFFAAPERGARALVRVATAPELAAQNGCYFKKDRIVPPSKTARDPELAATLWALCESLHNRPESA